MIVFPAQCCKCREPWAVSEREWVSEPAHSLTRVENWEKLLTLTHGDQNLQTLCSLTHAHSRTFFWAVNFIIIWISRLFLGEKIIFLGKIARLTPFLHELACDCDQELSDDKSEFSRWWHHSRSSKFHKYNKASQAAFLILFFHSNT